MPMLPKATPGVRFVILALIVVGVLFVAYKVSYTNVPPERLAATEMVDLASAARTRIAETFADRGTLDGATEELLPPAQAAHPNSKGPFEWRLEPDGTLTGTSARHGLRLVLRTEDQGATWTCELTPTEFAPRVGVCGSGR